MGLRSFNRQIRQELISEAREQGLEQGREQRRAAGRQEIPDELRAKIPEEIRQILEQADQPTAITTTAAKPRRDEPGP